MPVMPVAVFGGLFFFVPGLIGLLRIVRSEAGGSSFIGLDLAILTTAPSNERRLVVEATYVSAVHGTLNLNGAVAFTIDNLVAVP